MEGDRLPLLRLAGSSVVALPLICTDGCRGCCVMKRPWDGMYDRQMVKPAAAGSVCRGAQLPYSEAILFAALPGGR